VTYRNLPAGPIQHSSQPEKGISRLLKAEHLPSAGDIRDEPGHFSLAGGNDLHL
jgi:hypothetical protein